MILSKRLMCQVFTLRLTATTLCFITGAASADEFPQCHGLQQKHDDLLKRIRDIQQDPGYIQDGKPNPEDLKLVKALLQQLTSVNSGLAQCRANQCVEGADLLNAAPDAPVCDGNVCVSISAIEQNVYQRLHNRVVGYSLAVGRSPQFISCGRARTNVDAPEASYKSSTKLQMASVSKVITTLAAIRILKQNGVDLSWPIGPHLPKDWVVDPAVAKITFQELLSHTSGIRDYGNNDQDYQILKQFFTQKIVPGGPISTDPAVKKQGFYSNYNFSIFRILLPMVNGFADKDPVHRAENLANEYVRLVQTNVFEPVGVKGADCQPPAQSNSYALAYGFPGDKPGYDWGNMRLKCGAAGWFASAADMAKVLVSLNQQDQRILSIDQWKQMEALHLGWDDLTAGKYRYLEKNGGLSWNGTSVSTSIAIFGPASPGPGVTGILFMNSDINGEPGVGADTVLREAFLKAIRPKL